MIVDGVVQSRWWTSYASTGIGRLLAPENSVAYRRHICCRGEGHLPTPRLRGTPVVPCVSRVTVPACVICTWFVHGYMLGCGAHIQALGWMTRYLISSTPSHEPIWIRYLFLAPSEVAPAPSDVPHTPVLINVRWWLFWRAKFWSCSVGRVGSNNNWRTCWNGLRSCSNLSSLLCVQSPLLRFVLI